MKIDEKIVEITFLFFVDSLDYNGIPLTTIMEMFKFSEKQLRTKIGELIKSDRVVLVCEQSNPHIKLIEDSSKDVQLSCIKQKELRTMCLYPTCEYLKQNADISTVEDKPFSKMLLFGAPQLRPIYFDLFVLEPYFNDPRYDFINHDNCGSIHIINEENSKGMHKKDQVYLETFGVGADVNDHKVIAVFLRYLSDFSPEHQQMWHTRMREDKCRLDSDYFRSSYLGEWSEGISIYKAVLQEIKMINELSLLLSKPKLFREDYHEDRPKLFGTILRPTLKNYYEFIQLLDKMLSDNLNTNFFKNDGISFEIEEVRKDGKIVVKNKSSLNLFEEWLRRYYKAKNVEIFDEIFMPLRKIRKLRNKPAHSVIDDDYDLGIHKKQNELIRDIFESLSSIRLVFQNHPKTKSYSLPRWYDISKIKIY